MTLVAIGALRINMYIAQTFLNVLILYTNRHHLNHDPTSTHIWRASLATEQYLTLYYSTGRMIIGHQRNSTIVLMAMRQLRDDER